MEEQETELRKSRWLAAVEDVLAEHPDWMGETVLAAQRGLKEARERDLDRIEALSMGLWQAVSTRPGAKRRNREMIVKAIEASLLATSPWADEAIAKEKGSGS